MAQADRLNQWANIAKIAAAIVALITLILGGGFFYGEVWNVSDLRYTILPTHDMKDIAFSGLVVENRGRVPARDIDIIVTGLEHDIELLHIPGPHEKADTTWDPNNLTNGVTVETERLSPGSSLSIYLLTSGPVTLAQGQTFTISSDQGRARPSSGPGTSDSSPLWGAFYFAIGFFASLFGGWWASKIIEGKGNR
jgi:hypothetical protein